MCKNIQQDWAPAQVAKHVQGPEHTKTRTPQHCIHQAWKYTPVILVHGGQDQYKKFRSVWATTHATSELGAVGGIKVDGEKRKYISATILIKISKKIWLFSHKNVYANWSTLSNDLINTNLFLFLEIDNTFFVVVNIFLLTRLYVYL